MVVDIGFSRITSFKLHEAPGGRNFGSGESYTFYRVWKASKLDTSLLKVNSRYNGTPRGLKNCNEGGCDHCNGKVKLQDSSQECLCLHAEENALLEAGRERIGKNCVLYCNTYASSICLCFHSWLPTISSCPCLKCTVKIIQTGVKTVVYNLTYKVSVMLFFFHCA